MLQTSEIRWGILGCAGIAIKRFLPALQASEQGVGQAIASRDLAKAKETAARFSVRKAYGSYEQLLLDPDVDAIYIPLPNHIHAEWIRRSAEAGKHILCEKPIALNALEAESIAQACQEHSVFLGEAFMYRFEARYARIREILDSGELGAVVGIHGSFTYNKSGEKDNIRFHADMGGGVIYDVGCYSLHAARLIFNREPSAVNVYAYFDERYDGVDTTASGLVEFGGGSFLLFDCSMLAEPRNQLDVLCERGKIEIPNAFNTNQQETTLIITAGGERRVETFEGSDPYLLEIDQFSQGIAGRAEFPFDTEDFIHNMRLIDACYLSARERRRVEL